MKRWFLLLPFWCMGCGTAPLADTMDRLFPARMPPAQGGHYYGGVGPAPVPEGAPPPVVGGESPFLDPESGAPAPLR